jgi:phosphonatase-like hydrolase
VPILSRRRAFQAIAAAAALPPAQGASRQPVKLVVLDVGGTIVEDRGDVPAAFEAAFAAQNLRITPEQISQFRGAAKREVVRHFVAAQAPKDQQKKLSDLIYRDFSARIIAAYQTARPIPGAEEAFRSMRGAGLLLATSTGFDRPITDSIFHRLDWFQYFAATITSDDVRTGRPAPYMLFHAMEAANVDAVTQAVAVGDTPLDLEAGSNAAFRGVIGVLSGVGKESALRAQPHTEIISSVADLPALLREKYL